MINQPTRSLVLSLSRIRPVTQGLAGSLASLLSTIIYLPCCKTELPAVQLELQLTSHEYDSTRDRQVMQQLNRITGR